MSTEHKNLNTGISSADKAQLIRQMRSKGPVQDVPSRRVRSEVSQGQHRESCLKQIPEYRNLNTLWSVAEKMGITDPFFLCHQALAKDTTMVQGQNLLNFSTYDYLSLNGSSSINQAAWEAMQRYGTSAGASRLVSGEKPVHQELERALADFFGLQDSVIFVSGHATNIWTLYQLFDHQDLVLYDSLVHNSLLKGAQFSGAHRMAFAHNDHSHLQSILQEHRSRFQKTVIITEGLFSMDGDYPDLPALVELKNKYQCFLMLDEAHSLGTLGASGRGLSEHYGLLASNIDILMGTLSKTLCGCGGFIAAESELIRFLKYSAPGFVYSVGMSPPLAAASLAALRELQAAPEKIRHLQRISAFFLDYARQKGLDTGHAAGVAIVPVIVGNSFLAGVLSRMLIQRGINVLPIMYPAVEEKKARLRFFLSSAHTKDQVRQALDATAQELPKAREFIRQAATQLQSSAP